jgi:hypothetical protein
MNRPFQDFKFLTPTSTIINGKAATIKAEIYQASKEQHLPARSGNAAQLRFYSITYAGENTSQLLNEVELIELIGKVRFQEI